MKAKITEVKKAYTTKKGESRQNYRVSIEDFYVDVSGKPEHKDGDYIDVTYREFYDKEKSVYRPLWVEK